MRDRSDKVLILGCGTIGQIKAALWLSMGSSVYLYDISPYRVDKLLRMDKRLQRFSEQQIDDLTVDISTPSNQHASSLLWAFETIKTPRAVLVEKPICTNISDRAVINRLLDNHNGVPVYVNESYFWSSALDQLISQLRENNEQITSIEINLSKNRLADTHAGRFFDRELESYGIEIPHAIAILQKLGVDVDELRICTNRIYRSKKFSFNQGVHLVLTDASGCIIKIDSFLGDFIIQVGKKVQNALMRWLIVETDKRNRYHVSFDPAPNEPRFKSVITINNKQRVVLDDNHLLKHLEQVQFGGLSSAMRQYLSPTNSIAIYDFLEKLYTSKIEDYVSDAVVQYSEVGERKVVV